MAIEDYKIDSDDSGNDYVGLDLEGFLAPYDGEYEGEWRPHSQQIDALVKTLVKAKLNGLIDAILATNPNWRENYAATAPTLDTADKSGIYVATVNGIDGRVLHFGSSGGTIAIQTFYGWNGTILHRTKQSSVWGAWGDPTQAFTFAAGFSASLAGGGNIYIDGRTAIFNFSITSANALTAGTCYTVGTLPAGYRADYPIFGNAMTTSGVTFSVSTNPANHEVTFVPRSGSTGAGAVIRGQLVWKF